jgi:multidrug efflux pump subunit AcrA (membrane-fusion protein)
MTNSLLITAIFLATTGQLSELDSAPSSQITNPEIEALITVADVVKLPAKEAGVLVQLGVDEGDVVQKDQKIGQIDDSEAQIQKKAAYSGAQAAWMKSEDTVEIEFQKISADVYRKEYERLIESNRQNPRSVPESDVALAKLKWDQALLGTEKTTYDQKIAKVEYNAKRAELTAAENTIQRRIITAPFAGVVEEVFRKQDEWVTAGDPILHLFRLDTMKVVGNVDSTQYDPHEIQGCEVTVVVPMARGRQETLRGRITRISTIERGGGVFEVGAEVQNRQEQGVWILRHLQEAKMTIHLGTGGRAAAGVSRAE